MKAGFAAALLVLLTGSAIAQPAAPSSSVNSESEEITSLAQNLDNAIKFCSEQIGRASAGDQNVGNVEARAVQAGMVEFLTDPPAPIAAMARPQYGPPRFARWFDPHAVILIVSYQQTPTCRIVVTNSEWAHRVLPELQRFVQIGDFWRPNESNEAAPEGLIRTVFTAQIRSNTTTQPILTITQPREPAGQTSVQLTIGVSLVNRTQ